MSLKNDKKQNIKNLDNVFKIIEEKEDIVETEEEKEIRENTKKEKNKIRLFLIILISLVLVLIASYTVISIFDNINGQYKDLKFANRDSYILKNVDDSLLKNYLQKDKYTIVAFMASWCSHCQAESPILSKFMAANKNVNIIVVSHDKKIEDIEEFLSENNYKWFVIFDSEKTIRSSIDPKLSSIPLTFLLDDEGNVIDKITGEASFDRLTEMYEKTKIQQKK